MAAKRIGLKQVDLVVPGMKKAEVQKILPPFGKASEISIGSGQRHIAINIGSGAFTRPLVQMPLLIMSH